MKNKSTYNNTPVKDLNLTDVEKAIRVIQKSAPPIEKIEVTPAYFIQLKKELPSTEILPIAAMPIIVNPLLKKPFKIFYKTHEK